MERFSKAQGYFLAGYSKRTIHSNTYCLQDWYTNAMDARQAILLRDCLPNEIRLLHSESNLSGKSVLASSGILKGAQWFLSVFKRPSAGGWTKSNTPFLTSAKMDFELWVKLSRENKQIELCFFSIPVSHNTGRVVSIRQ